MIGKKGVTIIVVVIIAYGYNLHSSKREPSPVVETKLGKVQGLTGVSRGGHIFYEYLGIPFAQPPIGKLRFEPPQAIKDGWDGIRDASVHGPECAQLKLLFGGYSGQEDCLYLNVFTPKERKGLLPVMVFIHGGAFITGSSTMYGARYFMDTSESNQVVLVTINYRLAALGFLNTGDGVVRGNMGLMDQNMALRFVQQNIEAFGGDPKKVTLFGESAGSASTGFHVLSPMSKGLFSKAIMQSGTCSSNWAVFPEPARQARRFAEKFGCTNESSVEMVECMKNVDAFTFVNGHQEVLMPLREQITVFVPTVEPLADKSSFLTKRPMDILKSGVFNKVPILAGVNSEEGLLTAAIVTNNQSKLDQANNEYYFWAPRILYFSPEKSKQTSDKIRKFYFGEVDSIATKSLVRNYTNMLSDRMFFAPLHNFAAEYRKHAPTRLYYYAYEGQFSFARVLASSQKPYLTPLINIMLDMVTRWVEENVLGWKLEHPGVCHADEIPMMFDWPLSLPMTKTSKDYPTSKTVVDMWTSFAHNSDRVNFDSMEWTPLKPEGDLMYLEINVKSQMIREPFKDRIEFWKSLGV